MQSISKSSLWLIAALVGVILIPIVLRPARTDTASLGTADDVLVIVTPHNEATRFEFTRAFAARHKARTGRTVAIDWRTPGGASDIARYIASEYLGAFRLHWERDLRQPWSNEVEAAFANPRVEPGTETLAARARKAFLESNVGCGVDLYFGGGSYDLIQQANAGRLVDCGVVAAHPDLFGPGGSIPPVFRGEPLFDTKGRWIGAALAAFGICYNTDALTRLGIERPPSEWRDLADPRLLGETALSDPTQSGSAAKAFEMLIQQQIAETAKEGGEVDVAEGWARGMRLIRRIAGNARYFTDAASKVPWDVESGDAAAGMAIDFYGRYQSEAVRRPDGASRMGYVTPANGSSFGADPIGMLRGAPSAALASEFVEFVISPEGQKLWNWKLGTPGGPVKYALRRLPILPELYAPKYEPYRSDPGVNPYTEGGFVYHPEWTAGLFRVIGFVIQVSCIDTHEELREAWSAAIEAGFPPAAMESFDSMEGIDYKTALEVIKPALASAQKIDQVRLAKTLGDRFRRQYREATRLSRGEPTLKR